MNLIKLSVDTIQNHQLNDYLDVLRKLNQDPYYKINHVVKDVLAKLENKFYTNMLDFFIQLNDS